MQMPCDHSLNQSCIATLKAKNLLDYSYNHTYFDAASQVGIQKHKHVLLFSETLFETQFIPVFTNLNRLLGVFPRTPKIKRI